MDDNIQTRLQETAKTCLEAYGVWEQKKTDSKAQEALHASIHELRKVSSRLEIELAISERDQITSKPLPIPSHRSNNKCIPHQSQVAQGGGQPPRQAEIMKKGPPKRRTTRTPRRSDTE